jgi:hypothetical protein
MVRASLIARLLLIIVFLAVMSGVPSAVEALPVCPSDGITRTTSGSTAYGSTCNDALGNLSSQEWPKMSCPYGLYDYTFIHNDCYWNGSVYQATGWFSYQCQTDCHNPEL